MRKKKYSTHYVNVEILGPRQYAFMRDIIEPLLDIYAIGIEWRREDGTPIEDRDLPRRVQQ